MKNKILKNTLFTIAFLLLPIFFSPQLAIAESLLPASSGEYKCAEDQKPTQAENLAAWKKQCGNYGLNDIVLVAVSATSILLGLSGSVALLFFIYGGVVFLTSGGNTERVSTGKKIIINSIIGIILMFTSYIIISFVMTSLGYAEGTFGRWNISL